MAWELKGKYPAIFDDPVVGDRSRRAVRRRPGAARPDRRREAAAGQRRLRLLPGQLRRRRHRRLHRRDADGRAGPVPRAPPAVGARGADDFRSLADYIAPVEIGPGRLPRRLRGDDRRRRRRAGRASSRPTHDDYNAIMAKALADRLAEAFAEMLHQQARRDWGYGRDERSRPTT